MDRSLITLKALTYEPTGGIVAAVTTSLPEEVGGVRNWGYRYCWLRDATYTLQALLAAGYRREAGAWREWLLRAIAGQPERCRSCTAWTARGGFPRSSWVASGYEGSSPVRTGTPRPGSSSSTSRARHWTPCSWPGRPAFPPTTHGRCRWR